MCKYYVLYATDRQMEPIPATVGQRWGSTSVVARQYRADLNLPAITLSISVIHFHAHTDLHKLGQERWDYRPELFSKGEKEIQRCEFNCCLAAIPPHRGLVSVSHVTSAFY